MSFVLFLLFVLLLWFPQNVQHEGMHAIAVKMFGAYDIKLRPYPKWEKGKWWPKYFALMTYKIDKKMEDWQSGLFSSAPQITNTVIMSVVIFILLFSSLPVWLTSLLFAIFIVNFIDGGANLGSLIIRKEGYSNDAWDAIKDFKISTNTGRVLVVVWYTVFAALGLAHLLG